MPDKPKGMHWRTYDRLTKKLRCQHEVREDLFTESAIKIIARAVGQAASSALRSVDAPLNEPILVLRPRSG
jgi:hypothetical protein